MAFYDVRFYSRAEHVRHVLQHLRLLEKFRSLMERSYAERRGRRVRHIKIPQTQPR